MPKKKQNKKQRLGHLRKLIQEIHPGKKPRNLSKVYTDGEQLSTAWNTLLEESVDQNMQDLQHVPTSWLKQAHPDEYGWIEGGFFEDHGIISGRVAMRLLDKLRKELGPDPEKALIIWEPLSELALVQLREITDREIKAYTETIEKYLSEQRTQRTQIKQKTASVELGELAKRIGYDKALKLLRSAAK